MLPPLEKPYDDTLIPQEYVIDYICVCRQFQIKYKFKECIVLKVINAQAIPNMPWQDVPKGFEGVIWRYSENPIIKRNPCKGSARVFNSAVIPYKGEFVGIFRADHTNVTPGLHVGFSRNGIDWEIKEEEIRWKDKDGNDFNSAYSYDPRLIWLEDAYYIVWCTENNGPVLGIGRTNDFENFERLSNITTPFNRNGVPFPRKINGKYHMLNRPSDNGHTPFGDIFISESPDLIYWGNHKLVMETSEENWWESKKIGAGNPPIETDEGWLMFYHGVVNTCNGYVYSIGAALLDIDNPSKVLYRSPAYLLCPEESYEVCGFVPNVCFPCAAIADAPTGRIALYYGAADTYVALAFTTVERTIDYLKNPYKF